MDAFKRRIYVNEYSEAGFAYLFGKLDRLHYLASEGHLSEATPLHTSEVIGWLEDIIFTVEETIREIEAHAARLHGFTQNQAHDPERRSDGEL